MKSNVVLLGAGLELGESVREVCPTCGGGSTKEKSLSITKTPEGLVWQCFRATCAERGGTSRGGTLPPKIAEPEKKRRAVFDGVTKALDERHLERIHKLWRISDPPHWWYAPERGRVAMSVRSPKYTHRGWVLRDIWGTKQIKALTYIDEGQESLSWYRKDQSAPTVVVEDIPSAVRASAYVNAVALLGTRMGLDRAMEIAEYAPRPIVIALDQDATVESIKMAQRYSLLWDGPIVLPLRKDLKDMTEDELISTLTQWQLRRMENES